MLRHLKNANELVLYASVSCGVAFIGRVFPAFYFPILLIRVAIFGYCAYIIAYTEGNKVVAVMLGGSIFIGLLGGYWDLIEVYLKFNPSQIVTVISLVSLTTLGVLLSIVIKQGKLNGTSRQK